MGCSKKEIVELVKHPDYSVDVTDVTNIDLIKAKLVALEKKMIKIIVEEENLTCWIALNNTFTRIGTSTWDKVTDYWNGVLFQLGGYYGLSTSAPMFSLKHIVFERENGTVIHTLDNSADEFAAQMHWINVVAKKPGGIRRDPMTLHDLSRLRLDPPEPIHRYFEPYMGGLTFWHDRDDGYTVEATKNMFHNRYTFCFERTDQLVVEIYKNDTMVPGLDFSDLAVIRLVGRAGTDPDDAMNPPQRPGYQTLGAKTP